MVHEEPPMAFDGWSCPGPTGEAFAARALLESVIGAVYLVLGGGAALDPARLKALEETLARALEGSLSRVEVSCHLQDVEQDLDTMGLDEHIDVLCRVLSSENDKEELVRIAELAAQMNGGPTREQRGLLDALERSCDQRLKRH